MTLVFNNSFVILLLWPCSWERKKKNEIYSHDDFGHDFCSNDHFGHLHSPDDFGHGHCEFGQFHFDQMYCHHHLPHSLHSHSGHPCSKHKNGGNNGDSHELFHSYDHSNHLYIVDMELPLDLHHKIEKKSNKGTHGLQLD